MSYSCSKISSSYSIYYQINKRHLFKFGVNYQVISFKEERPEIYFSPKQFTSLEMFIDLDLFNSKSKSIVRGNAALGYKFVNKDKGEDTDEWALNQNYISIVPVEFDLTAHHAIQELNEWNFK